MHDRLRQQWRDRVGRAPEPSAAIIDAQSTRSTAQGGDTGFDAGKKVVLNIGHGIAHCPLCKHSVAVEPQRPAGRR